MSERVANDRRWRASAVATDEQRHLGNLGPGESEWLQELKSTGLAYPALLRPKSGWTHGDPPTEFFVDAVPGLWQQEAFRQ